MYCDFLGRCGDEVFNQLPKWQAMSGNVLKMPVVLRISVGSKYGAQHSQDWTSLVAHIPDDNNHVHKTSPAASTSSDYRMGVKPD